MLVHPLTAAASRQPATSVRGRTSTRASWGKPPLYLGGPVSARRDCFDDPWRTSCSGLLVSKGASGSVRANGTPSSTRQAPGTRATIGVAAIDLISKAVLGTSRHHP